MLRPFRDKPHFPFEIRPCSSIYKTGLVDSPEIQCPRPLAEAGPLQFPPSVLLPPHRTLQTCRHLTHDLAESVSLTLSKAHTGEGSLESSIVCEPLGRSCRGFYCLGWFSPCPIQRRSRYGFAHDCCHRVPERWEVVTDRIYIRDHTSSSGWYLYQVSPVEPAFIDYIPNLEGRCPTECRLSYSDQAWKCGVVLSKIVDKHGQVLGVAENIPFGTTITDKGDVEERIRRAQRAILNPSVNADTFLLGPDGDPDGGNELSFSKNSVCLEIRGPDLTDLSFCDLPGTWFPPYYVVLVVL